METAQMNRVNVQTPNMQMTQSTASKDMVSDVGSFQDTLKDLNAPENSANASETVKASEVKPVVTQEQIDQVQKPEVAKTPEVVQTQNNLQNLVQDLMQTTEMPKQPEKDVMSVQSKAPEHDLISEMLRPLAEEKELMSEMSQAKVGEQNVVSEITKQPEKAPVQNPENLMVQPEEQSLQTPLNNPVDQAVKELAILPQIINESKDVKETKGLKEPKGLVKIGHISKEDEVSQFDKDLKILDESLKVVSDKNLNAEQTQVLPEKIDVNRSVISNLDTKVSDSTATLQTLSELNSKISALNSISSVSSKAKTPLGSIKMNKEDANFFVNMVENQNNNVFQANVTVNANNQVTFTEAKAQAAQSSAAVSQALIDKLKESMNTNKAFRVDFDNNVAVIMRVDSNGVLSANFIPGSSAVEQYLRNNIAELRQAFENKGLEYNELSYSSRKQNQNKQQRNQRGGKDE